MNPTKPKIPWFCAISLHFRQIVQNSYGINYWSPPVPPRYFMDFYPSLPHLPHPIRHSTNGIQQKLCFFEERSVAFDICGRICYNKCTKGNTADRRSIQIWLITKRTRILWSGRLLFCVIYVCYQDSRSDDSRNYQNDCLAFARNPV